MQRDIELVRQILLEIENRPWAESRRPVEIEGRTDEEVAYHLKLLHDAGLIEGIDTTSSSGLGYTPGLLTWEGHDFLDAARQDDRWRRAMTTVREKAGSVTFALVKEVLVGLAKGQLGL